MRGTPPTKSTDPMQLGDYVYYMKFLNADYSWGKLGFSGIDFIQGKVIALTETHATLKLNTWFFTTIAVARDICFESPIKACEFLMGNLERSRKEAVQS